MSVHMSVMWHNMGDFFFLQNLACKFNYLVADVVVYMSINHDQWTIILICKELIIKTAVSLTTLVLLT
jgi:hypothetical protein